MKRIPLKIPDEYITALSERLRFDLRPQNLATRNGKAYIAEKAGIVSTISDGLTKSRDIFLASDYLKSKPMREAYLLYYMTTNMLKAIQPLREVALSNFFGNESIRVLDLGTGTGSAVWGLLSYFQSCHSEHSDAPIRSVSEESESTENDDLEITLTDSLEENLIETRNFAKYFLRQNTSVHSRLSFEKYDLKTPKDIPEKLKIKAPYHLITMMNVLNELPETGDGILIESLLSLLDDHGALIMIEPATRTESRRLLRFRDLAVGRGATIYSPCTRQSGCPALINEDDWCHTTIDWERPAFIKAIDDLTGTLRLSLKSSYIIIRKDGVTIGNSLYQHNLYRVVSECFDEKGRNRAFLCGDNGRNEYVMNKRDLTISNQAFSEVERYDVIKVEGVEKREHDLRITELSPISIVLPILGAR